MEFFKILIFVGAVLVSSGDSIKNYDLCEKGDITASNGTTISFNFSSVGPDEGNSTCERIIYSSQERLVLTLNTFVGNSSDVFQITDGAFGGQTINPTTSKTGKIYESTGNSMRIVLKVKSALKESSLGYIEGTFTALPFHATCSCSGIQNGHVRCRDSYLERQCTVHCRKDYIDLFKSMGNFTCNLVNGKWNKEYQNAVGCIKTPSLPGVELQVNFTSDNKTVCNETLKNDTYDAISKHLLSQEAIKENSVCFKFNFRQCFQYSCDSRGDKSFVVVHIQDNATGRWDVNGNNKALFNAYNNTNWIKIVSDVLIYKQNESTIDKDSVESKVSTKCPNGTFEILSQFTCSKCPPGAFYKSSTRTCEKCPNGTTSSEGSTECQRNKILPQPDACDITCMAGKELDKILGFCQWCRLDTYRNSSDVAANCALCPNGKRTLYRGSSNVDDCHIPCNKGTFFDVSVKSCALCSLGTYQNRTNHLFSWCTPCKNGKVTHKEGSKDFSECFPVCKRGHFFNNQTRNCTKCPVGTYQNSTNQMSCQKCPIGTTTLSAGSYLSSECIEMCQKGHYFNATYMTCLNCSLGTYLDKNDHLKRACIKCESNKTTYVKGAVSKTQCFQACSPGHYLNFSQSVCVKCEIGSYQNSERQLQCIRCPNGKLTRNIGSTKASDCVKACLNGTFFNAQNSSCLDCPLGTYMTKRGHTETQCTECGGNKTTYVKGSSDSSQCFPKCTVGQYFETALSSCKECALGFYQMKPEQLSCSECPPGLNTTRTGTTSSLGCVKSKVLCDQGEFYDPKTEKCYLCENGTYQSAENHNLTSCQSCLSGRTKDKGAKDISDCIEGCDSFPCKNGAECKETGNVFACHCPKGISGQYCDVFENKDKLQKIQESVRFTSLTWSTALEKTSSLQYKEVSYKIEKALKESVFEKYESFVGVQVTKLLAGSVIAEFDIYLNESASVDPADLRQSLRNAVAQGSIGGLSVDPSFPKAPTEKPEEPSAVKTNPNINTIKDEKDEYAWGQYLGIAFGLLMAIVIGVSCFLWWRSSKKKKQKEDTPLVLTRFQDGSYREMPREDEEDDAV